MNSRPLSRPLVNKARTVSVYDADAAAYFSAVLANGGKLFSPGYEESATKAKFNAAFVAAKDLGIWNALIDWGIFCGVGNLNGLLVKARNTTGAPLLTNLNFLETDYSPSGATLGLQGGAGRYLVTGLTGTALPQDDASLGLFVTIPSQVSNVQSSLGVDSTSAGALSFVKSSGGGMVARVFSTTSVTLGSVSNTTKGVIGASRTGSGTVQTIFPGDTGPQDRANTSAAPLNLAVSVMARGAGSDPFLARVSGYWFGRAVNLPAMRQLWDTLNASFGFMP